MLHLKTARFALALTLLLVAVSLCHAQTSAAAILADEPWDSIWGQVRFTNVSSPADGPVTFTGRWSGAFETGRIESGTFDPNSGEITFRYAQESLNGVNRGSAQLRLAQSEGKYILAGVYTHDSGRRGPWEMWRSTCGLSSDYDMVDAAQDGSLARCIRECGNEAHFWYQGAPRGGHRYLALNSLGKSALSSHAVAAYLKEHIQEVFPFAARGLDGPTVEVGHRFIVTFDLVLGESGYSNVRCTMANDYQFTFETIPDQHILQGYITFGVFKDQCGELWLFQEGHGPKDELAARALFNYATARPLWEQMAHNLEHAMETMTPEDEDDPDADSDPK